MLWCFLVLHWADSFTMNHCHVYFYSVLWWLALTHIGSICVILCLFVASHQVGEIEEQLAAARREVTKSEEANQKLQREVKEVCGASLSLPSQNHGLPHDFQPKCIFDHSAGICCGVKWGQWRLFQQRIVGVAAWTMNTFHFLFSCWGSDRWPVVSIKSIISTVISGILYFSFRPFAKGRTWRKGLQH